MHSSSGSSGRPRRRRSRSVLSDSPMNNTSELLLVPDAVCFVSCHQTVREVISSFDERKRDILDSIGFGGLLSIPDITYENKLFSIWLMSRLSWFFKYISVGDRVTMNITPQHIGEITGLKCSGMVISNDSLETNDEKLAFIKCNFSFLNTEIGIVEAAEQFVKQPFPIEICKQDIDNFKISFVIYVIGRFLSPSSEDPDGQTNFWGALQNPDQIASYNWSSYVFSNLLKAARLVEWATPRKITLSSIGGCPLILQIFYLDHIDFGKMNVSHDLLPRWKYFTNDSFKDMIRADTLVTSIGCSTSPLFGRIKILRKGSNSSTHVPPECIVAAPSVHNVSTPCFPSSKKPSSIAQPHSAQPLKIVVNEENTRYESSTHSELPTIFGKTQTLEPLLDFAALIKNSFQGEVDEKILEDLKLYNAKCLDHLFKSYRSLATSIMTENASIALKLLENKQYNSVNRKFDVPVEISSTRRRNYKDFTTGTDSSTEGEDITPRSKIGRAMVSRFSLGSSSGDETVVADKHRLKDTSALMKFPNAPPLVQSELKWSRASHLSIKESATTPATISIPASSGAVVVTNKQNYSKHTDYNKTPMSNAMSAKMKATSFDTPEATLKMSLLSPNVSPTTENQSFSGACLSVRMLDSMIGIDLNASTFDDQYNLSIEPKKKCTPGHMSLSHWELNLKHSETDPLIINAISDWVSSNSTNELERYWIIHNIPRAINLSGHTLKEEFFCMKPMSFEVLDVSIRRMKQLDKCIYPAELPYRWRHFLESDYALHVLGAENPVENKSIRYQFVGSDSDYDLSSCRMFFVPMLVNGTWWCYAWDLKLDVVVIFDPSLGKERDAVVIKKHFGTIEQLASSLTGIINDLITGWLPEFTFTKHVVFRLTGIPYSRERSGLMTLFAMWNYDGSKLVVDCNMASLNKFKSYFLYQLLDMDGNTGLSPTTYLNIID